MEKIIKRDIFDQIIKYLNTNNIIVLYGARQVGKSYIMFYLENYLKEKKELTEFFDLEDSRFLELLDKGTDDFFNYLKAQGYNFDELKNTGKKLFVFIDEAQYLENPSSFLKLIHDHHHYLQIIVSGSSSFDIKSKFSDSLAGRTVNFEIFNLSFSEFLRFKSVNFDLHATSLSPIHLEKIVSLYEEYACYGGYPKIVLENIVEKKEKYLMQIIDTYIRKDIKDIAKIKDTKKFNQFLSVLAEQSGQLLNKAATARACSLSLQTVDKYLFILENTYVIKLLYSFSNSARVMVAKTPKLFFYDTGLMQMLLLKQLPGRFTEVGARLSVLAGHNFETSVFAELVKKYGQTNIYTWRTKSQAEIDFVLNNKSTPLPIEVKLNFDNMRDRAMASFREKYKITDYIITGLRGAKRDSHCRYPWEL